MLKPGEVQSRGIVFDEQEMQRRYFEGKKKRVLSKVLQRAGRGAQSDLPAAVAEYWEVLHPERPAGRSSKSCEKTTSLPETAP